MADTKISALTAIGTLGADDLFAVVDDPGGTPLSRKATGAQLRTFVLTAPVTFTVDDANNATVTYPLRLTHTTSGTPAIGIGSGLEFEVETAAGNNEVGMKLTAEASTVGAGTEDFDLVYYMMQSGAAAAERMRCESGGRFRVLGSGCGFAFQNRGGGETTTLARNSEVTSFYDGLGGGDQWRIAHATGYVSFGKDVTPDRQLHAEETSATTNAVTYVERLTSTSSGTPANNIGVGVEYEVETAAANNEIGATLEVVATDTTAASEDFTVRVKTMTAGQAAATSLQFSLPGTVYPQGHIFGLTMSNDGGDTTNDIAIAAGECVDETGVWNMTLSALTKRIDATWVVGTGQGGMANNGTGVADSNWYEVLVIGREDTRVVDVAFSLTANRATLPTNYTHKRRIGWVRRGASTNLQFTQIDDHVTWTTQINDSSTAITATAAAITLTAPPSSIARFRATLQVTAVALAGEMVTVFSEIVEGNVTPAGSTGIASLGSNGQNATSASNDWTAAGHFELRVSSTSTIEHDSAIGTGGAGTFDISTFGFIDHRRRMSAT